jgi:hypothetical protein
MKLFLREFYSDLGYEFKISWKVMKFMRQKLSDIIFNNYPIDPKYSGFDIDFNITTNRNTVSVEVKGPVKDGRNKMEVYGIWLPYERIVKAENMLQEFLDCFFEAMRMFFRKHNVPDEVVLRVKKEVEEEVLNNEEYVYVESEF